MSTSEQLIKARLGALALAQQLDNIRLACKRAGISKSPFYEIKAAYEKYGPDGLAPQPRRRPRMPNQIPAEIEARILQMTEQFPTYSYVRISHLIPPRHPRATAAGSLRFFFSAIASSIC